MNINRILFIVLGSVLATTACTKQDIALNVPAESLYLDTRTLKIEENFANYVDSVESILVSVRVNVTGEPKDYDRTYQLVRLDSSTAVSGKDYEFVNDRLVVEAGALTSLAELRLNRSGDLGDEGVRLYLKLAPGTDFQTPIVGFADVSAIMVNDQINEPLYWNSFAYNYLGPYSEKKFRLLQRIGDMPDNALSEFPTNDREYQFLLGSLKRWGLLLKRYIDEQRHAGTPVLEEDETPMRYGSYM